MIRHQDVIKTRGTGIRAQAQGTERKPHTPLLRGCQTGSVTVLTALCMMILLGILAFVLDTGYLYATKNRYQNAVEAAALAGAMALCDDPEQAAETILLENLFSEEDRPESLSSSEGGPLFIGYYDPESKSFLDLGELSEEQYENAVRVDLRTNTPSLSGFHREANLHAGALSFLKRYSITSLNGSIRLAQGVTVDGGDVYANEDVTLVKSWDCSKAAVTKGRILAAGQVHFENESFFGQSCPWSEGEKSDHMSGVPVIEDIPPADEEVERWRTRADVVLTRTDLGGNILFWRNPNWPAGTGSDDVYFFDLTYANPGEVIFFDPEGADVVAMIKNQVELYGEGDKSHSSNPEAKGVTFVTPCPIWLDDGDPVRYGGEYQDQVCLVSSSNIKCYELNPETTEIGGMVLRAGGNVHIGYSSYGEAGRIWMRIIADGNIEIENGNTIDVLFGPPCPPRIARLVDAE